MPFPFLRPGASSRTSSHLGVGDVRLVFDSPLMEDDAASTAQATDTLVCIECGDESSVGARGWRAYTLAAELLVYCPGCASREFDDAD